LLILFETRLVNREVDLLIERGRQKDLCWKWRRL